MMEFTFDFLARLKDNVYLTMLDGAQLVNLREDGIISYNHEVQRGSRKEVKNNEEIEEDVYSKTNVKKIYEAMVAGNYFEDLITLNLLDDGNSSFSDVFYDEANEFNAFTTYGKIDIADGQHRIRALKMLNDSNEEGITSIPLTEFNFPVKITHYDIKTAQQQFHQFLEGLKISSSRTEYFNATDYSNEIVRKLMRSSDLAED